MRRIAIAVAVPLFMLFSFVAEAAADKPDTPTLDAALKTAVERKAPVLIDFQAPWCYSCYYMAKHVLVGPEWEKIEHRTVVVELDADSPEGAYWKNLWGVKALPSYVILKPDGKELGRILAEQRQDEFINQVNDILKRSTTLEDLKTVAAAGNGAASLKATREALSVYRARYDDAGLAWYQGLPADARKTYDADPAIALLIERLSLLRASKAGDAALCEAIAPKVLAGELGCERPYEIDRWNACTEKSPPAVRKAVFESQLAPMQRLVEQRVFGKGPLCADQRSEVLALADVYEATGRKAEREALLRKAVAQVQKRAEAKLGADRNLADNWRVYLEVLEDNAALDALYPKLIAAYPDDYVYAFRYGRNLLARGQAQQALPYLEQASAKAYGQNRLKVAEQRVKALKALKRDADARTVVAEALKANGPWFPEDAAKLKAAL